MALHELYGNWREKPTKTARAECFDEASPECFDRASSSAPYRHLLLKEREAGYLETSSSSFPKPPSGLSMFCATRSQPTRQINSITVNTGTYRSGERLNRCKQRSSNSQFSTQCRLLHDRFASAVEPLIPQQARSEVGPNCERDQLSVDLHTREIKI